MHEPFESEPEAFRFVILTLVAFAAITAASLLGGAWAGFVVWLLLTVAVALTYLTRRGDRVARTQPARTAPADERRILVVERDAPESDAIVREISRLADGSPTRVLLVAPLQTSALHRWVSDVDAERTSARLRLDAALDRLTAAGIEAEAQVGGEDPLTAIDDALRTFGADEILVMAHGDAHEIVDAARERYVVPISVVAA